MKKMMINETTEKELQEKFPTWKLKTNGNYNLPEEIFIIKTNDGFYKVIDNRKGRVKNHTCCYLRECYVFISGRG